MLRLENVSKVFRRYASPADRLRESIPFASIKSSEFWALRDINLTLPPGQFFGVVGANGGGKSTLLEIAAGVLTPTGGRVHSDGRIAALLALGAGYNPEFSGRENVYLNGEILGISRREMRQLLPHIERFAEIGEFIDRPLKEYSSGMFVRLAFATAIHADPQLLIVDEVLAVGDAVFANRCIRKFEELRRRNVTVLFVSHDLGLVKRLADRAGILSGGQFVAQGVPSDITNQYVGMVLERQKAEQVSSPANMNPSFRHGDGASRIVSVRLLNRAGEIVKVIESGACLMVTVRVLAYRQLNQPIVGILIRSRLGIDVYGTNTQVEGLCLDSIGVGEEFEVTFSFECLLAQQEYTVTAATQHAEGFSQDWLDDAVSFHVSDARKLAGVASLKTTVGWRKCTNSSGELV